MAEVVTLRRRPAVPASLARAGIRGAPAIRLAPDRLAGAFVRMFRAECEAFIAKKQAARAAGG